MLIPGFRPPRQFRNLPLRTKLIVTSLVASIVPLAIVGILANLATRQALVNAANDSLAGAAAQTATNLDGFIQANLNAVRVEAQLPEFGDVLALSPERQVSGAGMADPSARVATTLRAL